MPPGLLTRRGLLNLVATAGVMAVGTSRMRRIFALAKTDGDATGAGALPDAISAVMQKPRYVNSTWSLLVTDLSTGEPVHELQPDALAFTGSVRKLFSVGLALNQLSSDYRFTTPIYKQGAIDAQGVLQGDLILVAAGDLTLGGRANADGSITYTDFDHNDANTLGTAILTPQDPLAGLDNLAQQVAVSGIGSVTGDVIIDDRLFDSFRVPNQNLLITPIMANENMVDVTVTPTQIGQPASMDWRPKSAAFAVDGTVETTAPRLSDTVDLSGNGRVTCTGTEGCSGTVSGGIPADYRAPLSNSPVLVRTFRIEDPANFARITLMEALSRAGVSVASAIVAPNDRSRLPAAPYSADDLVAQYVSAPYSEYAKLILKVSLNLGANLSLMLFGLAKGQRTIAGALNVERQTLTSQMRIDGASFDFPTNGSGSPDSMATPRAVVQLLTQMAKTDVERAYRAGLPILGVDGSLAHSGADLPAKGSVFAKTGTTIDATGLKAQNLAGYIDAKSGKQLAFALFVNDAGPIESIDDVGEVFEDEATITNAIYELN